MGGAGGKKDKSTHLPNPVKSPAAVKRSTEKEEKVFVGGKPVWDLGRKFLMLHNEVCSSLLSREKKRLASPFVLEEANDLPRPALL